MKYRNRQRADNKYDIYKLFITNYYKNGIIKLLWSTYQSRIMFGVFRALCFDTNEDENE